MNGTVLITGASGFFGSHLAVALAMRGTSVLAATRGTGTPARLADRIGPQLRVVRWDPADPASVFTFRPDIVIHAAACYGRTGEPPAALVEANVLAGLRLLDASGQAGVRAFLHVGTGLPGDVSPYARSKRQFADWAAALAGDLAVVEMRCEHFFGAGDDPSKFTTRIARACLAGQPSLALTTGTQRRDFIHVDDAVAGFLAVLDRGLPARGHACYPLGSGAAVPVRSVVERLHRRAASTTRLDFGAVPVRPAEPEICQADTTALRALGWAPDIGLEAGLDRFVDEERALCAS